MGTNVKLILVKNSDGKSKAIRLDLDADLKTIREKLTTAGVMKKGDVFIYEGASLEVGDEAEVLLGDILVDEKVLNIGTPGKPPSGDLDYESLDYDQKLAFLGSGSANINVFNGLSVQKSTGEKVGFVRKFHKLFRFADGYLPSELKPGVIFDFESLLTFSEESHSMQTYGVSSSTISLDTPWASAEASYEHAKKESSSSKTVKSFFTDRHVCNKVELSIDPAQMIPDYEFIKKVKEAVDKDRGIDKYFALVQVLNEWGWYVPLEFTLGSALYATERKEVNSFEYAVEESTKFNVSFKAAFKGIGAGAGSGGEGGSGEDGGGEEGSEKIVFYQLGGSVIGKDNFPEWVESLDNAKVWAIIAYPKLYPSLLLLAYKETEIFNVCSSVLREFNSHSSVKDLQKYINVSDYEYEMAKLTGGSWEYKKVK